MEYCDDDRHYIRVNPVVQKRIQVCHGNETVLTPHTDTMTTRIGHAWTKQEEDSILADIEAGLHIGDIAVKQQRTTGGIRSRLTRLACCFVKDKSMSLYEAAGRTGIRAARIQKVLAQTEAKAACPTKTDYNFAATMSREALLDLPRQNKITFIRCFIETRLGNQVERAAGVGKTSFLWEIGEEQLARESHAQHSPVTLNDLVEAIRVKYLGCSVEKVEEWVDQLRPCVGQPSTRVLKTGIKIDWS